LACVIMYKVGYNNRRKFAEKEIGGAEAEAKEKAEAEKTDEVDGKEKVSPIETAPLKDDAKPEKKNPVPIIPTVK